MSDDRVDGMVRQVMNLLSQRDSSSAKDVFAWSDGTVTGPRDNTDERVGELRLIGQFTAAESPTEAAVRETLERGMSEARDSAKDEATAVAHGDRPQELPGTPPAVRG